MVNICNDTVCNLVSYLCTSSKLGIWAKIKKLSFSYNLAITESRLVSPVRVCLSFIWKERSFFFFCCSSRNSWSIVLALTPLTFRIEVCSVSAFGIHIEFYWSSHQQQLGGMRRYRCEEFTHNFEVRKCDQSHLME